MWGRKKKVEPEPEQKLVGPWPLQLTEAVRQARLENAERTGVIVDLRDAELARIELLNEALDPLFAEVSPQVELFDRGISKGETPRLWIDPVAHVAMGRDKRVYRFLLDTRSGRKILAESPNASEIVKAVTIYVARRLVERERALAEEPLPLIAEAERVTSNEHQWPHRHQFWRRSLALIYFVIIYLGLSYITTR